MNKIKNIEQLKQTQQAINHLELAIAHLREEDVLPVRYEMMVEGVIDEVKELRELVDEYLEI